MRFYAHFRSAAEIFRRNGAASGNAEKEPTGIAIGGTVKTAILSKPLFTDRFCYIPIPDLSVHAWRAAKKGGRT